MLGCEHRSRKWFSQRDYCKKTNSDCSLWDMAWCKGVIIGVFIVIALAYFAYGIVWAWQGAEARREGSVAGGQWSVAIQRAEALEAEIKEEADRKDLVLAILECESSSRPNVYGDGGKSYGIAQVQKRTWDYLAPLAGIKGDWKDPENQVALLDWAIQNGYGDNWTCYRKIKGV